MRPEALRAALKFLLVCTSSKDEALAVEMKLGHVTANRRFSRSMIRFRPWIKYIEDSVAKCDTTSLPFDILQISFVDETDRSVDVISPTKGDRLCQACIPCFERADVDYDSRVAFVTEVARRAAPVFDALGLPAKTSKSLMETVIAAGHKALEIGDELGPEIDSPESTWPHPGWKTK